MRRSLILFFLFSLIKVVAQPTTFIKRIVRDSSANEVATSLIVGENEEITVGLGVVCNTFCTKQIKFDKYGQIVWKNNNSMIRRSNENGLTSLNDTLYESGYYYPNTERLLKFLKINKQNGNLYSSITINLTNQTTFRPVAHGSLIVDNNLLIYGWMNMPDDTSVGIIQWYDLSKDSIGSFKTYRTPKNKYNDVVDLQKGYDGNLHYISFNKQKYSTGNIDSRRITTISSSGEILRSFDYRHDNEGIYFPMSLAIFKNNDYVFNACQPDSIFGGYNTVQLVRTTNLGKPVWTYNWPTFWVGEKAVYLVGDIKVTANGDIIGCGYVQPPGFYDGYIFRMSGDGKMLWERRINIKDNLDDNFDIFAFTCLDEDSKGNIVVAGEYRNSFYKDQNGVLVKLDANGCIEGYGCSGRIVLDKFTVSTEDLSQKEDSFSIYPNPVAFLLHIDCIDPSFVYHVRLYDCLGREILSQSHQQGNISIDCSALPNGWYSLRILDNKGRLLHSQKVVK